MAVENVNNVLSKFEQDKNLSDSLDTGEKTELTKVQKVDCMREKQKLENTVIYKKRIKDRASAEILEKPVTLKEVMKTFEYNTKVVNGKTTYESFVTINGKKEKINPKSDLGALIQMYALSHNEVANVGRTGIDGTIGEKTINGLNQANLIGKKTETPKGKQPEQNDQLEEVDRFLKQNVYDLVENGYYTDYVGVYNDVKYNLIENKEGHNKGKIKNKEVNGKKVTIKFKSQVTKLNETIIVDATQAEVQGGGYSPKKFGKVIENAIRTKEIELQKKENDKKENEKIALENKSIENGIWNYHDSNFKSKILKDYFGQDSINSIVCKRIEGEFVYINDTITGASAKISRKDLLTGGKFDSKKYEEQILKIYEKQALNHAKGKVKKTIDNLPAQHSLHKIRNVDTAIGKSNSLLKEINKYGYENEFKDLANAVDKKIKGYELQKKYLDGKSTIEDAINTINNKRKSNSDFIKNFDEIYEQIKKIVFVEKNNRAKFTYTIKYNNSMRQKFKAVGKDDEYCKLVDSIINKWKNIKEGGDLKYNLTIVGR